MTVKKKKFELFGSTYTIQYLDKVVGDNGEWVYGITNPQSNVIQLSLKYNDGRVIPDNELELTLLHELMHCIFMTGQYHTCWDDEPLVEWCARCIVSLKKQKII